MGQLYAFLAVLLFIISHSQVKALSHFPVYEIVFFRAFGILLLSIPLMLFTKVSLKGRDKKTLILRGVFGSIALFCYFLTLQNLSLSTAVVIQQLSPFFAIMISGVLLKEKTALRVYLLFLLAFFGIYLIKDPESSFSVYYLLGLVAAVFSALAYNYVRKLKSTDHPLVVLTYFHFILLPVSVSLLFVKGGMLPEKSDFKHIAALALFTFLAQLCLTLAYHRAKVSKVSSFNFLSIPLSALVGWYFFSEKLKGLQILGIAIVFAVVLLQIYLSKSGSTSKLKKT